MSSKSDPNEENNSTYKGPISITNPKEENIVDVIQNMLMERNDLIHNQLLVVDDMIRNPTTENVGPEDEGIVKRILKRDENIQELLKMSKDMDELRRDLKKTTETNGTRIEGIAIAILEDSYIMIKVQQHYCSVPCFDARNSIAQCIEFLIY